MNKHIQGLYAVIDPTFLPKQWSPVEYARWLLEGGCQIIQLRMKDAQGDDERCSIAKDILTLKRYFHFMFIINDDVACAKELRADGVHLGQEDMPLAKARELLGPEALIGYSSHALEEAVMAERAGASYVAFGAIFPTQTKSIGYPIQGLTRLTQVVQNLSVPVVAIGGIHRENIGQVRETGVQSVAMITGLSYASDPKAEAQWYVQRLQKPSSVVRRPSSVKTEYGIRNTNDG